MTTALSVLRFIGVILEVLLIFNLVIIVHELGHFLAARWRGLYVEEFGVWFGKPLWRKKFGGVWYSLGSIPAGGFVKLPQMAPMETLEGESDVPREALAPVGPLDKVITAVAGPFFSFLLALFLATIVWVVGNPVSQPTNTTVIGSVEKGEPGEKADLRRGDRIISIDGKPVRKFFGAVYSVNWAVMSSQGETIDFLIERDGKQMHIPTGWTRDATERWKRERPRQVKIGPLFVPYVFEVKAGSLSQKVGLQPGDIVEAVNGTPIMSLGQIEEIGDLTPDAPLVLTVARPPGPAAEVSRGTVVADQGAPANAPRHTLTVPAIPKAEINKEDSVKYIPGVVFGRYGYAYPTPWEQVKTHVITMRNMISGLIDNIFFRKGDVKPSQFSGPVGIMNIYRMMLESPDGWRMAIAFSVFFNVNLAILNLLPFPVLDGGHITLALIEKVRRRPANARLLEWVQTACALLLFSFILYVSFFDIGEHINWPKKAAPTPAEVQPTVIEKAP